jgi:D-alanyl-D-alanine carboxypeptidase
VATFGRTIALIGRCFANAGIALAVLVAVTAATPAAASKYASIVIDADTGEVLQHVNADARTYPASLTKMMTLYLLFEDLQAGKVSLDQRFTVSRHAANQAPSKLGLQPGETIAVKDLILALVTKSANDGAVTVAEGLSGSESAFAERMTRKAKALGMRDTVFRNASGLPDPAQHTTARDISRLSLALYRDFPKQYHYFATTEFTYHGVTHANHNHLMSSFEGMDGIKTGFIRASGFNLAASAMRGNRRLIGVVMGGESARGRDRHMAALLNDAFARGANGTTLVAAKTSDGDDADDAADSSSPAERVLRSLSPVGTAHAAPMRSTKAAAARRDHGSWSIQVGAFSKAHAAEKAANAAAAKIAGGKKRAVNIVAPSRGDKERVWRARLANFSKTEARDACRVLKKKRIQCAVIAPSA